MRFTKPNLAALVLPPGKSELILFEDAVPGFGVRLRAGGKRTWIAQYRVGSKQRRLTLGSCDILDPDEARRRAKDALAQVRLGADPQVEKAENRAKASVTLGVVVDRYLKAAERRLRPRSLIDTERYLRRYWGPLHEIPVHKVQRVSVAGRLGEIGTENGLVAANRARAALSALFGWALGEGLAETNPVVGTNRPAEEVSRDRVLTDVELVAVWRACREDDYGRIVRLLILTAQRREEVGALVRAEVDTLAAMWVIPGARTKNGVPHEVPLARPALSLLAATPERAGKPTMFGDGVATFSGWSKAKTALDQRIAETGFAMPPWRLHDLRRTAATRMADLGTHPHVVEAILNHISGHKGGVAGVYNRATYRAEKREALNRWASHVAHLTTRGGR